MEEGQNASSMVKPGQSFAQWKRLKRAIGWAGASLVGVDPLVGNGVTARMV